MDTVVLKFGGSSVADNIKLNIVADKIKKFYRREFYETKQDKEIAKAVKAIHDLCEAVKKIDANHQQQAFNACLFELAKEMNW